MVSVETGRDKPGYNPFRESYGDAITEVRGHHSSDDS
ncbi:hypothetical protein SAMN04488692_105153 [Halarsenatibacter silvermanii]|uniref:Uncharacterized protein n=1 Tax=Halarsenatibacter silvermanii TaxID=321763 RepID=A0A1G9L1E1_9FIRM|nr:hypothetical protein SAMN04488692_105153 [Halarsenatibacter silvermanii]